MSIFGLHIGMLWDGPWGHHRGGLFLLKELCCICRISCFISIGFVSMLPIESLRQFKGVLMDGLNIFLCMFLALVFSRSLYFAMVFFQLMVVCLVVILYASSLVVRHIVVSSSIHCLTVASLAGVGGMCVFFRVYNCWMSRWPGQLAHGVECATHIAFLVMWYILRWDFHIFCCFRGRKPPCCRALCDSELGVCVSRHVALMHALNMLIISWNVSWTSSHYIRLRCEMFSF